MAYLVKEELGQMPAGHIGNVGTQLAIIPCLTLPHPRPTLPVRDKQGKGTELIGRP